MNGSIPGTLQLRKDCSISASLNLPKLELSQTSEEGRKEGRKEGQKEERGPFQGGQPHPNLSSHCASTEKVFSPVCLLFPRQEKRRGKGREKVGEGEAVRGWEKFLVGEVLHQSENSTPIGIHRRLEAPKTLQHLGHPHGMTASPVIASSFTSSFLPHTIFCRKS